MGLLRQGQNTKRAPENPSEGILRNPISSIIGDITRTFACVWSPLSTMIKSTVKPEIQCSKRQKAIIGTFQQRGTGFNFYVFKQDLTLQTELKSWGRGWVPTNSHSPPCCSRSLSCFGVKIIPSSRTCPNFLSFCDCSNKPSQHFRN